MPKLKDPIDELVEMLNRSPALFADRMGRLAKALIGRNRGEIEDQENELTQLIGETMALADLVGRKRLLMEFDASQRRKTFRFRDDLAKVNYFDSTPVFPRIEFKEAFEDLIGREPRLANNAEEIRKVYGTGGFALQRIPKTFSQQARLKLTERIQSKIASFINEGTPAPQASQVLAEMGGFSQSYAETVFRNNLATAYTAGRFRQAADPDVREVIGAFEFESVGDDDTRPNHDAANGMIAPMDHAAWERFSPPIGHRCRCAIRFVDMFELEDRGLIVRGKPRPWFPPGFDKAKPDKNFKVQRTDRRIYG